MYRSTWTGSLSLKLLDYSRLAASGINFAKWEFAGSNGDTPIQRMYVVPFSNPQKTRLSSRRTNSLPMTATAMATPVPVPPIGIECNRSDMEVVELPLLLPRWQAEVLEAAASRRGMTTGQILRRVIGDLFGNVPPATDATVRGR